MGCFDRSCAITRTGIHYPDECVIVHCLDKLAYNTYDFMDAIYFYKRIGEQVRKFAEIVSELQKLYSGCITNTVNAPKQICEVFRGIYNDYGWLEDQPRQDWQDNTFFYVHVDVAREICTIQKRDYNNDLELAQALAEYAFICRIQLFTPSHILGAQSDTKVELLKQKQLCEMTMGILDDKLNDGWVEEA